MASSLKTKALNFNEHLIIALDGPAGSGKGTIGKMIANYLKLDYFQSSLLYRSLAVICIENKVNLSNTNHIISLSKSLEINKYIKESAKGSDEVIGVTASVIATIPEVRKNLSKHLTKIIHDSPRIIMEGRDIGTIIAPNADLKIFITADINTRAIRRYKQLIEEGKECIVTEILEQLIKRDLRDQERSVSPLAPAEDALIIDTSNLTPLDVFTAVVKFINHK